MSHAGRRAGPQRAAGLFVTVRGGSLPARGRRLPLNPAARGGRRCPSAGACAAGVSLPGRAPAAAHGTSRRGRGPGRAGRGGAASRRGLPARRLWRPWDGGAPPRPRRSRGKAPALSPRSDNRAAAEPSPPQAPRRWGRAGEPLPRSTPTPPPPGPHRVGSGACKMAARGSMLSLRAGWVRYVCERSGAVASGPAFGGRLGSSRLARGSSGA